MGTSPEASGLLRPMQRGLWSKEVTARMLRLGYVPTRWSSANGAVTQLFRDQHRRRSASASFALGHPRSPKGLIQTPDE